MFRKNENDHVAQHWTHELRRTRQFGLLPFEQLKVLLLDEDYANSVVEWNKPTKNKKWYHPTTEALLNLMYVVSDNERQDDFYHSLKN